MQAKLKLQPLEDAMQKWVDYNSPRSHSALQLQPKLCKKVTSYIYKHEKNSSKTGQPASRVGYLQPSPHDLPEELDYAIYGQQFEGKLHHFQELEEDEPTEVSDGLGTSILFLSWLAICKHWPAVCCQVRSSASAASRLRFSRRREFSMSRIRDQMA
eukprot:2105561-Pleurochrysis_carterae.AAC.1